MIAKLAFGVVIGIVTMYGPGFEGGALYCDEFCQVGLMCDLAFSRSTLERVGTPWIAVDPSYFENGWRCGDLVRIEYAQGLTIEYLVLDAGPLSQFCVTPFCGKLKIIADVAIYGWPKGHGWISWPDSVRMVNIDYVRRVFEQYVSR